MEVDFITLGDASKRLDVPSPTLRNWTDQLEEFEVHHVKRNNRNERMYYDSDLKIFEFIRDLKEEYGRKTTMKDIANLLKDDERFELRSQEDAPSPVQEPSNKTADLINADDIQRLMDNQRVRALLSVVVAETTHQIRQEVFEKMHQQWNIEKDSLKEVFREEFIQELQKGQKQVSEQLVNLQENQSKQLEELEENQKKREENQKEWITKRDKEFTEFLEIRKKELEERKVNESKGFFSKLFGK